MNASSNLPETTPSNRKHFFCRLNPGLYIFALAQLLTFALATALIKSFFLFKVILMNFDFVSAVVELNPY